jgi:hypothetical protein
VQFLELSHYCFMCHHLCTVFIMVVMYEQVTHVTSEYTVMSSAILVYIQLVCILQRTQSLMYSFIECLFMHFLLLGRIPLLEKLFIFFI